MPCPAVGEQPSELCQPFDGSAALRGSVAWRIERDDRIHLSVARGTRAPQRPGVIGHSSTPGNQAPPWIDSRGLRISRAARVWLELASQLELVDLVIAGDYLLRGFRERDGSHAPFVTIPQLRTAAAGHAHRRHSALIATALELISERVDSPYETRLRLIVHSAGFPDPVVNVPILDAAGEVIAQPDLRIPGFNVGIEYQGDGHRTDKSQWRRDVVRRLERELRQRGWSGTSTWPTLGVGG